MYYPKFIVFTIVFFSAGLINGQSVTGIWKTIDDKSGEPKSHVKIYKNDGKLYGEVIKLLPAAVGDTCIHCPGEKKGKPIKGMQIMWDLKKYDDQWDDGEILDPKTGKIYNCKLWLKNEDRLTVRGYIGISLIGRSQIWHRVE